MHLPIDIESQLSGLPGAELVLPGLRDLAEDRRESLEACLVMIARTRLSQAGLKCLDGLDPDERDFERLLYLQLEKSDSASAYSLYNSFKRRLDSFIRAFECRLAASA